MTVNRLSTNRLDFRAINVFCMSRFLSMVKLWLPDGKLNGQEWIALNPTRQDRRAGSFKINVKTGRWSDFATGDSGGDVISLYAYLNGLKQIEAARALRDQLGGAL